jgi:hypothetical protein
MPDALTVASVVNSTIRERDITRENPRFGIGLTA